jgi:hypothetical protein
MPLFLLLLWGARRGHSVVAPDAMALASIAVWAAITMFGLVWIAIGSGGSRDGTVQDALRQ